MSDLISRSELLKRFLVSKDGHRIPERDCDNLEVTVSVKDVKEIIKEQPTVYSVDKVVEELNELPIKAIDRYKGGVFGNWEGTDYYINKTNAIEIVKQGGVADDVCEWHCDEYERYHTECHYLADNDPLEYTYCPYCGKKIKVVY